MGILLDVSAWLGDSLAPNGRRFRGRALPLRRARPPVVSVSERARAVARSPIVIHPCPRRAALCQDDLPPPALEIVPLRSIDGGENFRRVESIHLTDHRAAPIDETRIGSQIE
jgi:hypothetical protein